MSIKIPVIAFTIEDPFEQTDQTDNTFENPLFDVDDYKNFSKIAYLTMHSIKKSLYPASAEIHSIKYLGDEVVDGEDRDSFAFKRDKVLETGSFKVEYDYDFNTDTDVPKFIVIN